MDAKCFDVTCRSLFLFTFIAVASALSACQKNEWPPRPNVGGNVNSTGIVELGITAYNYTNQSIDIFSVDGQGGGNVHLSGPNGGGGGTVCCVSYIKASQNPKVTVRWQTDACTYSHKSSPGVTPISGLHRFFKEQEISIGGEIPAKPNYLEVHFYPHGHVEAAITENASRPRLILARNGEDDSDYRSCPGGTKPVNE